MVELSVIDRDDFVFWLAHSSVDESLNGLCDQSVLIDGLLVRLGNLQHDAPVGTVSLSLGVDTA